MRLWSFDWIAGFRWIERYIGKYNISKRYYRTEMRMRERTLIAYTHPHKIISPARSCEMKRNVCCCCCWVRLQSLFVLLVHWYHSTVNQKISSMRNSWSRTYSQRWTQRVRVRVSKRLNKNITFRCECKRDSGMRGRERINGWIVEWKREREYF